MIARYLASGNVALSLDEGDVVATAVGPCEVEILPLPGLLIWDALVAAGVTPEPAPEVEPPMPVISDRQFGRGLWVEGVIDWDAFLAFIGPGTIPAPLAQIIATLPDDDTGAPTPRKDAVAFVTGSRLYEFDHPLVETVRKVLVASEPKWTPSYLRQQWRVWATN